MKLKVFIPIIMVLFMLQSCGSNTSPEEENDLVDVNPVVEEDDEQAAYDPQDPGDNDGRNDENELENEQDRNAEDNGIGIGLDYEIGEDDSPEYGYGFE